MNVNTPMRYRTPNSPEGFTLIELLIVIAIIALISAIVILVLNPAELLKQSRDSTRISDLATLKSAISLYLVDNTTNPNLAFIYGYGVCYVSSISGNGTSSARCGVFTTMGATVVSSSQANYRKLDATGWLPVRFSQMNNGVPFSDLPVDPVNNASYYYAYAATSTNYSYEIDAFMESQKYGVNGPKDVVTKDGGDNDSVFEVGTNLNL